MPYCCERCDPWIEEYLAARYARTIEDFVRAAENDKALDYEDPPLRQKRLVSKHPSQSRQNRGRKLNKWARPRAWSEDDYDDGKVYPEVTNDVPKSNEILKTIRRLEREKRILQATLDFWYEQLHDE